ncbi:MAG: flagellar biosynthesis protein FlhB [Bacteroidota bacterium]
MAEQNNDQEKTEEPTPRKLEKAREEGNVSKSQELSSAVMLLVSALVVYFMGAWMMRRLLSMFERIFLMSSKPIDDLNTAVAMIGNGFLTAVNILAPVLIILLVAAILVTMVQTGIVFSAKAISFKGNRLDPIQGLKRVFSMNGLVELLKGVIKITVITMIIYYTVEDEISTFLSFMLMPISDTLPTAGSYILLLITRVLAALLVISIGDMIYQRYKHRKDLRMTKQEVKDEHKQMEGDPTVKSQRRQKAMEMSQQRRLDHAVIKSDVVVTNPTHYAVALQYDPEQNDAPIMMAKGMRKRALKIREMAKKYDVPIIENPPVARALYASAEEEEAIPPDQYEAVAEILAYVYRMRDKSL